MESSARAGMGLRPQRMSLAAVVVTCESWGLTCEVGKGSHQCCFPSWERKPGDLLNRAQNTKQSTVEESFAERHKARGTGCCLPPHVSWPEDCSVWKKSRICSAEFESGHCSLLLLSDERQVVLIFLTLSWEKDHDFEWWCVELQVTLELPVEGPEGTQTLGLEFWGVVCARERSWGLNCMCVFFEAPDLFDNTQREGTGEWRGGEEGTPENTLIRMT